MAANARRLGRAIRVAALGLTGTLVLLVVLLLAGLWYARSSGGRERLRRWVVDLARRSAPGFDLGSIQGDYLRSLVLQRVVLRDRHGGDAIEIEAVRLSYDLSGLLRRRIRIQQLTIERPSVLLRALGPGRSNLAELVVPAADEPQDETAQPQTSRWTVQLGQLRVDHGSFIDRRTTDGATVQALSLRATATLQPSDLKLTIEQLRGRAKLPDQPELDVSLQARGRLAQWKRVEDAQVTLRLEGLPAGPVALTTAITGPIKRLQLDAKAMLGDAGALQAKGWIDVLSQQLRYQLDLSLERLQPHLLVGTLPAMRLDSRIEARGTGLPLQPDSASSLRLELTNSAVAGVAIEQVTLAGSTSGMRWTVDQLDLAADGAQAQAAGSGTLEQIDARLSLRAPALERLPIPGAGPTGLDLAGSLQLEGTISGRFDGQLETDLRGSSRGLRIADARVRRLALKAKLRGLPRRPQGQLSLQARGASWADPPLRVDRLDASYDGGLQRGQADLTMHGLGGSATVGLQWRDDGSPRTSLRAAFRALRLPGLPPLSGRLVARAEPRYLRTTLSARLARKAARLTAEATLPIAYPSGALVPKLAARRKAKASLRLAELDLGLLRQLGLVQAEVDGRVGLRARLDGPLTGPRLDAELDLRAGRVGAIEGIAARATLALADQLQLRLEATQQQAALLQLQGTLQLSSAGALELAQAPLRRLGGLPLQLHCETGTVALEQLAQLHPSMAQLGGSARVVVEASGTLFRPQAELKLALDRGRWGGHRLQAARLEASLDGSDAASATAAQLALAIDGQALLRARGSLKRSVESLVRSPSRVGTAPLAAEIEILPTLLRRLRGQHELLAQLESGSLTGRATVAGTVARPTVEAGLRLADVRAAGTAIGNVQLEATVGADQLEAQVRLKQQQGGTLTGQASLVTGPGKPTVDASLQGKNLDLGFVSTLVPVLERSAGRLTLTAAAKGPLASPRINARVNLTDGRLRPRGMSELKGIRLRASLEPKRARIERLLIHSGAGRLSASGQIELAQLRPQGFQLTARANKFRLGVAPVDDATFDGRIEASGQRQGGLLKTSVTVTEGAVRVPKIESQRSLHTTGALTDIVFVDHAARVARARAKRKAKQLRAGNQGFELHTRADSLMVRGADLDVELAIDVRVKAMANSAPRVFGTIRIRRGQVSILDNRYTVDRALVRLSGQKEPDPSIDVRLRRDFAEGTVFISLQGTLSANELVLSSEPPNYDQAQLVSLVLTGRLDPRAADSGGDQATVLASAVAQAVFGLLAKQLTSRVGIDVTRVGISQVQDDKNSEARIRAEAELGKYITRRLYVAYRRVFGAAETENANEALGEYRISARWLLMALFGDRGVGNLDLAWTYRY